MINAVLYGFAKALNEEFPNAKKYIEDIPQGFTVPAFSLRTMPAFRDRKAINTVESEVTVIVQYFPEASREEINDVLDRMQECLEVIEVTIGGQTTQRRTVQTDSAIVDNVLTATFRTNDILFSKPTGDLMEELDSTVRD